MKALSCIGYAAKKLGFTFSDGSTWFNYRMPETNIGLYDAVKLLKTKYDTGAYVSYASSIDFTPLAYLFWQLSKFAELDDLSLYSKADQILISQTNNATAIYSEEVRAFNLWY